MTYQEKKNYVSLISTILIFGVYSLYLFIRYQEEIVNSTATIGFWGAVILVLIPITIAANIIITIVFIIIYRVTAKEEEPSFRDELDRLIELKAYRNSYLVFIAGFLLAMGAFAFELPLSWPFSLLIFSGFSAEVVAHITQLYHYRKGV